MHRTNSKLALHTLDAPGSSTTIDELSDDLLLLILTEVDWRTLSIVCCVSRRLRQVADEPGLWRGALSRLLQAKGWPAEPHQLADYMALRQAILRAPAAWRPPRALLRPDEPRGLSVSTDGRAVRFIGERLGGNRAVRIEPPLPTKPFDLLCAEVEALRGGAGSRAGGDVRFGVKSGCVVAYFEVAIGPRAADATTEGDCIAIGLGSSSFPLHGRQPGWDSHSFGYHSDDGRLFHGSGTRSRASWPRFTAGDVVGCGISVVTRQIFYTLNGRWACRGVMWCGRVAAWSRTHGCGLSACTQWKRRTPCHQHPPHSSPPSLAATSGLPSLPRRTSCRSSPLWASTRTSRSRSTS